MLKTCGKRLILSCMAKPRLGLLTVIALLFTSAVPSFAANDAAATMAARRGKIVMKSALYGIGGGLVVGLASQVVKRKSRNIFICGSLGLYAGLLLGLYVVTMPPADSKGSPYEGSDTYDDYSQEKNMDRLQSNLLLADTKKIDRDSTLLQLNFLQLRF